MKKMFSEFYEFISKGNVIGLAVGVIMGTAFNNIVTSVINDLFMPVIGLLTSNISFESWFIALNGESYPSLTAAKAAAAPIITIGNFISALINFLIVAVILFFIMKGMTKLMESQAKKEAETPTPAEPSEDVKLLAEIRDLLKAQKN